MVKLFGDVMSQPTRTVLIFCRCNNLPVEFVRVDVGKGQHRQPEYLAKFPLGKVPALQDGDFYLWESVAIMRYLLTKFPEQCKTHWYPEDVQTRARVDAVLCWHFNNTREGSMKLCWNRAIAPARGLPANSAMADAAEALLRGALKDLVRVWLADGRWLCAAAQPTIADLLIACELEQLRLLDGATKGPSMAALLAPHPSLITWMAAVRDASNPAYDEVHAILARAQHRFAQRRARM